MLPALAPPTASSPRDLWVVSVALVLLCLSAATGVYFRLITLGVLPASFTLENVRHAHSHLVIFGWAIPAMFVALGREFRPSLANARVMSPIYLSIFVLALASWPLFLGWGYGRTRIGDAALPLSVMVSGLGMLGWYAWMWRYFAANPAPRAGTTAETLALAAVAMLGASSFGAWGVAVAQAAGAGLRTTQFLTHAFLHVLALGFMGLGALALLLARSGSRRALDGVARAGVAGVLLSVLASSNSIDAPVLQIAGRVGLVLCALSSLRLVFEIARCATEKFAPEFVFVFAKAGAELALAFASPSMVERIVVDPTLRVLYLHVSLVGFASVVTLRVLVPPGVARTALIGGLSLVAISLLPLSSIWPPSFGGVWAWWAAALVGALAGFAALWAAFARSGRVARRSCAIPHV